MARQGPPGRSTAQERDHWTLRKHPAKLNVTSSASLFAQCDGPHEVAPAWPASGQVSGAGPSLGKWLGEGRNRYAEPETRSQAAGASLARGYSFLTLDAGSAQLELRSSKMPRMAAPRERIRNMNQLAIEADRAMLRALIEGKIPFNWSSATQPSLPGAGITEAE